MDISHHLLSQFLEKAAPIFIGKQDILKLSFISIFSQGHILLEDLPGVGKTTLIKLLAKTFDLELNRIQFTNDLLPSDVLGTVIFDKNAQEFKYHSGPLMGEIILADELNRAPPKTQSALLQAMEEKYISVDGKHIQLPQPFIVMATQNPQAQLGTYPLPESLVDRFMMKLDIGFPSRDEEIFLLKGEKRDLLIKQMASLTTKDAIIQSPKLIKEVHVSDAIFKYVSELLFKSRESIKYNPLSPRAGIDLITTARTWSYFHNQEFVTPEVIQHLFPYVCGHRLVVSTNQSRKLELELAKDIIDKTPIK